MNNSKIARISISTTYTDTTPESAEHGEHDAAGFVSVNERATFRDLLAALENAPHCSTFPPPSDGDRFTWYSGEAETVCYEKGTTRYISYHADNDRTARYMCKAWRYWHSI